MVGVQGEGAGQDAVSHEQLRLVHLQQRHLAAQVLQLLAPCLYLGLRLPLTVLMLTTALTLPTALTPTSTSRSCCVSLCLAVAEMLSAVFTFIL